MLTTLLTGLVWSTVAWILYRLQPSAADLAERYHREIEQEGK